MLRQTVRGLLRQPGFTCLALLILAVGSGATTAMFSLVNALTLRPLPYPDSERLVRIYRTQRAQRSWPHAPARFLALREQSRALDGVAAFETRTFSLVLPGEPAAPLAGLAVSADFFPLLGARAALGRLFTADEDAWQRNDVVVLSSEAWRTRFGADPAVVGRRVQVDGEAVTVLGVLPREIDHPLLWGKVELWRPLGLSPAMRQDRGNNWLQVMGRLAPGVGMDAAQAEASAIAARLTAGEVPSGLRLYPLGRSGMDETSTRIAWLSMGLGLLVLLIACANLAGLLLARHGARAREYAIRAALGASRARLWRQLTAESLLLAVAGGGLGLLAARWCTDLVGRRILVGNAGPGLAVPLDGTVVVFAVAMMLVTGLAAGGVPALLVSSGRVESSRSTPRLRQGLVVAEMALALLLLAASVLFLRGLARLVERDPGWKVDGVLTARLDFPPARYGSAERLRQLQADLAARLAALPGVQASALSWWLPLVSAGPTAFLAVDGAPELRQPGHEQRQAINYVTSDFFATLRIPLVEGRAFTSGDGPRSAPVAVINATLARRFWPGRSAVGQRLSRIGEPWSTVVGVVGDVRYPGKLSQMVTTLQVYRPLAQEPRPSLMIALRGQALEASLRRAVAAVDPALPLQEVTPARQVLETALANVSLLGWILFVFAAAGVGLSAAGVYGLFSVFVVSRTREIGVRVALGAEPRQVQRLVLARGLRLALLGVALGFPLGWSAARLLAAAAPELPPSEPALLLALGLAQLAVALLATWLPARRASAIDPMVAMRAE